MTKKNPIKVLQPWHKMLMFGVICFMYAGLQSVSAQTIRYVMQDGTGDGSSWDNASNDLQLMINQSSAGDQVWVAGGEYHPARPADNLNTVDENNRANAFVLKNGVHLYGGLFGYETQIGNRAIMSLNQTVLSGDFMNDDVTGSLSVDNNEENAYHVMIGVNLTLPTIVDGFFVVGGNADNSSSVTVNSVSVNNDYGGLIALYNSSVTFRNIILQAGFAQLGGGALLSHNSDVKLYNSGIVACHSNQGGAGIHLSGNAEITNVLIVNCFSGAGASAIYASKGTGQAVTITNISVANSGNRGDGYNLVTCTSGDCDIRNSIFYDNGDKRVFGRISYSIVEGSGGSESWNSSYGIDMGNNIDENPEWEFGNLQAGSPAINAGNSQFLMPGETPDLSYITTDIFGSPRFISSSVDMGAFEFAGGSDCEAPIVYDQTLCINSRVGDLDAGGIDVVYYAAPTGGSPLASDKKLVSGTYYAALNNESCESERTPFAVTIIYCGSQLSNSFCNSSVNLNTVVYADGVPGVSMYRFIVSDGVTTQNIDKQVRYFRLTELSSYAYGTAYSVQVGVFADGGWSYGAQCSLTSNPMPQLTLQSEYCGATVSFTTNLYAAGIPHATQYRFRITDLTDDMNEQVLDRPVRYLTVNQIPGYTYNKIYTVEIAVMVSGQWSEYGSACIVYTPAAPTSQLDTNYCGATMEKVKSIVYAQHISQTTRYRFRIIDGGNTYFLENTARYFRLQDVPGNTYSKTYTVDVSIQIGGNWGPYGPACTVSTPNSPSGRPGAASMAKGIDSVSVTANDEVVLTAYPNPYTESFTVEMITQRLDKITVQAFDMNGRLVENVTIAPEELSSKRLGSSYAAGIYNVVVTQGDYQKAFKVVKK